MSPGATPRPRSCLVVFLTLAVLGTACRPDPEVPSTGASERLQALADEVWAYALENTPRLRLREGLPVERLPDPSYDKAQQDFERARSISERLAEIDPAELTHEEVLSYEILAWQAAMDQEGFEYYWLDSYLTPYSNPLPGLRLIFGQYRLESSENLAAYLELVTQVADLANALQVRARGQLERGIVISQAALPAVLTLVKSTIQAPDAGMFHVVDERLESFEATEVDEFRDRLAEVVTQRVNPALEELHQFLAGEFQDQAPAGVGVRQYPRGEDYYRYRTRLQTTLEITPEEVQQIGFDMVAEMQERMAEIRDEIGFEGSQEAFHQQLRTDPRFFPSSPDEVAKGLMEASDAFFAQIHRFFVRTQKAPYGVRRLDPALEASLTYGYYDTPTAAEPTGYYNFNGSSLDQRSRLPLTALSLHELIPGHHFHIARQQENEALADFRRAAFPTAFTEGWGSYSSYLGLETDLYDDPYDRYGLYMLEIFLANRLVVDPGMNTFEWPLEKARQYMRDNTLESDTQIATETLRYSTDLIAQALGYQIGKRKFLELRKKAEDVLGDRFDLPRFHETVVGSGAMPMTVLEKHVDWFIEQELGG